MSQHLDFVALRAPVTCTLPTDPPETKRVVRQFRRLELERFEAAQALHNAGQYAEAVQQYYELARFALPDPPVTDRELDALSLQDLVRLLGAGMSKIEQVEAALGNVQGGGGTSMPTATPPPDIPASPTTIPEALPVGG